ncbi:MAG: hypothetical protein M0Z30_00340 [Actinomycetota bacterium]|nr:hypothetical protein [Actinomycetota bacterium]
MTATPQPPVTESVEAAARRLETIAPGYLDQIRERAAAMAVPPTPAGRARRAVDMVGASARINADVPAASRRRSARLLKRGVGVLTRFYFLHLTEQLTDMGEATSWMGRALCEYVESLEVEVSDLRTRVARLEQEQAHP